MGREEWKPGLGVELKMRYMVGGRIERMIERFVNINLRINKEKKQMLQ